MDKEASRVINFIEYSEGLKREIRNSWLTDNRKESVAEHTWRMSIMAIAIAPKTKLSLDIEKVMKMVAVHDITEIEAGDVPNVLHMLDSNIAAKKITDENLAIQNIKKLVNDSSGEEIYNLWLEFEAQDTNEAKFVKILDKFEAIIQKYQQSLESFKTQDELNRYGLPNYFTKLETMCEIDDFLTELLSEMMKRREASISEKIAEL